MSDTFSISGCTSGDYEEVAELLRPLWWGGQENNLRYLEWKYHNNPYLDGRYNVLARDLSGRLVGMVGVFGSQWERSGVRFTLPCVTDTMVAPEHRNSPLFHLMIDESLARLRADGLPWLLDFGDQGTIPAMLLRGWRMVGPWGLSVLTRTGDTTRPPWRELAPMPGSRSGVPISVVPEEDGNPPIEAMVEVAARVTRDDRTRVARDKTYFTWRAANPLARYYYLLAGAEKPAGYLVAHRSAMDTDDGESPTTIVECEADSEDVAADLIAAAHEHLPGRWILMWARDVCPAGQAALAELGSSTTEPTGRFTVDRPLPNLLVRDTGAVSDGSIPNDVTDPARWDFRGVTGRAWR